MIGTERHFRLGMIMYSVKDNAFGLTLLDFQGNIVAST
jgi:hypothetical protein